MPVDAAFAALDAAVAAFDAMFTGRVRICPANDGCTLIKRPNAPYLGGYAGITTSLPKCPRKSLMYVEKLS